MAIFPLSRALRTHPYDGRKERSCQEAGGSGFPVMSILGRFLLPANKAGSRKRRLLLPDGAGSPPPPSSIFQAVQELVHRNRRIPGRAGQWIKRNVGGRVAGEQLPEVIAPPKGYRH